MDHRPGRADIARLSPAEIDTLRVITLGRRLSRTRVTAHGRPRRAVQTGGERDRDTDRIRKKAPAAAGPAARNRKREAQRHIAVRRGALRFWQAAPSKSPGRCVLWDIGLWSTHLECGLLTSFKNVFPAGRRLRCPIANEWYGIAGLRHSFYGSSIGTRQGRVPYNRLFFALGVSYVAKRQTPRARLKAGSRAVGVARSSAETTYAPPVRRGASVVPRAAEKVASLAAPARPREHLLLLALLGLLLRDGRRVPAVEEVEWRLAAGRVCQDADNRER
jgi:hypothetical protein